MTNKIQKIREGIEKLKSNLIYGACSSQIAMETRCKEEAYNEVLAILDNTQEEPVSEDLEKAEKEWLTPQLDKSYADYGETKMMELTHFDGYAMLDAIEFGAKWQKTKDESTTEDLGEYIDELSKQFPEVSFAKLSRIAVRVSRWQQNQDVKNKLPKVTDRTELDEYAYQCAYNMSNDWAIDNPTWHDVEDACKLGAKWQKEQDQSTIELAEDHAMLAGMEKMKEEMMKEPNLSGYVARDEDGNLHIFEVEPRRLEEKHRWWDRDYHCHIIDNDAFPDLRWKDEPICVKLIIIKED